MTTLSAPFSASGAALPDAASEADLASPHNLSAEAGLLGAILYDNNAWQRIAELVRADDFYAPANQAIFAACTTLLQAGRVADGVTLRTRFEQDETLQSIGGAAYLAQLLDSAAFGPEITDYARIVRDLSVRRSLVTLGADITARATKPEPDQDGIEQIEQAESALFALAEKGSAARGFYSFTEALTEAISMAEAAFRRDGKIAGLATGFDELDHKTGGLHKSDLIILAGRPSMGKTSLATNIAHNAAAAWQGERGEDGAIKTINGARTAFFSLEMSAEQLATRILAERSGISGHRIRQGDLTRDDFEALREASQTLEDMPLYIDDQAGLSISQLVARARRLYRTKGIDLVIIDYLQLLGGSVNKRHDNRVQELTQITTALKALAKELSVPVIALSQLSRQVEMREDKRPLLSDLRDSGSIEQDADVVMFVYREAYYLERAEPEASSHDPDINEKWARWRARMDEVYGTAEIILGKQRHGPIGKCTLAFNANLTRFGNLETKRDGRP